MSTLTRITVVGLGYIGLPTAAALADNGLQVHGVDVNDATVRAVAQGLVPFAEPDLAGVVQRVAERGALTASGETMPADAFIVAVPTPFTEDRQADLSYVRAAVDQLAPVLRGGEIIILESTSPPGTTEEMGAWIQQARPDLALAGTGTSRPEVNLAYCPERVLPGRIMTEIVENDRVIGGLTPACAERAAAVYRRFCRGELLLTDARTAELCKLVENSYRDVNIAFANELAGVCEVLGVDVWRLIELANHHPRVNILRPGPGVGGHCIAVDPWFIVAAAPDDTTLIRTAREVNDRRPQAVVDGVLAAVGDLTDPVVATLGLAFKADVDDLRESPAVTVAAGVADALVGRGEVLAVEPYVSRLPAALANRRNVRLVDAEEAVEAADVVVLLVDHTRFADLAPAAGSKPVVDTRGMWTGPGRSR